MLAYVYVRACLVLSSFREHALGRTPLRAAGLLEYALLALLAVGVFAVLSRVFSGTFDTVICNVKSSLGQQAGPGECTVVDPINN